MPGQYLTAELVRAMLRAGVHRFAQRPDSYGRGMSEAKYAALWPKEVVMPADYANRYPHLLLVDQTLETNKLEACTEADFFVTPSACRVQSGSSGFLLGSDGKWLKRAVIFWGYEQNLGRSVVDCRPLATATNIPLIHWHGLWIIIQHRDGILCRHGIDLPGSSFGTSGALCVRRFGHPRTGFFTDNVASKNPGSGSAFRGSKFISVP